MMHSCALFCIPEHYGGTIPDLDARRAARSYSHHMRQYAQECVRMQKNTPECTKLWDHTSKEKYSRHMRQNAQECTSMSDRMRWNVSWNAPDCGTTHTYTREAERTQGQTHMWTQRIWAGRAVGVP